MKTREIAIQLILEELDRKTCNDTNLNDEILTEFETLDRENLGTRLCYIWWAVYPANRDFCDLPRSVGEGYVNGM